ncbi:hypothetical protein BC832DRAFT_550504 [Gaertneriomyces semiglobifer]|nr:hypothetical protein BC832DRAFT_550504 [Gaertneriomyces semiglobifer]
MATPINIRTNLGAESFSTNAWMSSQMYNSPVDSEPAPLDSIPSQPTTRSDQELYQPPTPETSPRLPTTGLPTTILPRRSSRFSVSVIKEHGKAKTNSVEPQQRKPSRFSLSMTPSTTQQQLASPSTSGEHGMDGSQESASRTSSSTPPINVIPPTPGHEYPAASHFQLSPAAEPLSSAPRATPLTIACMRPHTVAKIDPLPPPSPLLKAHTLAKSKPVLPEGTELADDDFHTVPTKVEPAVQVWHKGRFTVTKEHSTHWRPRQSLSRARSRFEITKVAAEEPLKGGLSVALGDVSVAD